MGFSLGCVLGHAGTGALVYLCTCANVYLCSSALVDLCSRCTGALVYLDLQDTQIHWFSIVNSVVVVFFLSGIITMIIIRTLRRDIAKYNMADDDIEESIEETGSQS